MRKGKICGVAASAGLTEELLCRVVADYSSNVDIHIQTATRRSCRTTANSRLKGVEEALSLGQDGADAVHHLPAVTRHKPTLRSTTLSPRPDDNFQGVVRINGSWSFVHS